MLVAHWVCNYGTHWTFGRYWMPSTLLAPDGRTYRDGAEVDVMSLAIARSGFEPECYLAAATGLGLLVGTLVYKMKRLHSMQVAAFNRERRRIHDMRWAKGG